MDYYKILHIKKTALQIEIKAQYKKLALIHHPDKSTGNKEEFQKILIAYEILSNEKKRKIYDIGFNYVNDNFDMNNYHFLLLPKIFIDYLLINSFYFDIRKFILYVYEKYKLKNEILLIKKIWKSYKLKDDNIILINITLNDYINNIQQSVLKNNKCIDCLNTNIKYICKKCKKNDTFDYLCDNFCEIMFEKIECKKCNIDNTMINLYPHNKYMKYNFNILSNNEFEIVNNKDVYTDVNIKLYQWLFGDIIKYTYLDGKIYKIKLEGYVNNTNLQYKINKKGVNGGDLYINFYVEFSDEDQQKIKLL